MGAPLINASCLGALGTTMPNTPTVPYVTQAVRASATPTVIKADPFSSRPTMGGTASIWVKVASGSSLTAALMLCAGVVDPTRDPNSWAFTSGLKLFPTQSAFSPAAELYNINSLLTFAFDTNAPISPLPADTWLNILWSYNTTQPAHQKTGLVFIGDTQVNDPSDNLDESIAFDTAFNEPPFCIGVNVGGHTIDIADFWFSQDSFMDLTIESNRRKFHDADGKPVYLGESGELPLGTSPTIFLRASGSDASTFMVNHGYGGNFANAAGTFSIAPTSPSD